MKTKSFTEVLDEIKKELLKDIQEDNEHRPNSSEVLEIYKPKNQHKFDDKNYTPIDLANAIIDLQNHVMLTNMVKIRNNCITKKEKKVLIEHLTELRGWIDTYLLDCIDYIAKNLSDEDEYANKSKEELIEELKKYKGE